MEGSAPNVAYRNVGRRVLGQFWRAGGPSWAKIRRKERRGSSSGAYNVFAAPNHTRSPSAVLHSDGGSPSSRCLGTRFQATLVGDELVARPAKRPDRGARAAHSAKGSPPRGAPPVWSLLGLSALWQEIKKLNRRAPPLVSKRGPPVK